MPKPASAAVTAANPVIGGVGEDTVKRRKSFPLGWWLKSPRWNAA